MTAEHFDGMMNQLVDKRPYTVFTIELHGGQRFEVEVRHVAQASHRERRGASPGSAENRLP